MNNTFLYATVMLLAGLGIPVMAALNSGLGTRLQSPALATVILFSLCLVIAVVYLFLTEGIPSVTYRPDTPWVFYLGGFFVMFYIISITWVAPHFGISNAISFVLLGQLLAMNLIDHFGLLGAPQFALSLSRILGLGFMIVGVFMALR
jgi:bacterial/archaeal transporter family-2 protein